MKITPQHLQYMADHIKPLDTPKRRQFYIDRKFVRADATKDVDKRYRWDLFWTANLAKFTSTVLYQYANDDHIDTALRQIVPPLEKPCIPTEQS